MAVNALTGSADGNYQIPEQQELKEKGNELENAFDVAGVEAGTETGANIGDSFEKAAGAENNTENADAAAQGTDGGKVKMSKKEYQALVDELNDTKNTLKPLQEQYDAADKEYKEYEKELKEKKEEYKAVQAKIEEATKELADEQKAIQQEAINNAMASYDKEKDGDFNAYLKEALASSGVSSSVSDKISGTLTSEEATLARDIQSLTGKMSNLEGIMSSLKITMDPLSMKITGLEEKINNAEVVGAALDTLLEEGLIEQAEYDLIKSLGDDIDLSEKLPNGNPKYIVAKGKQDGKFHVYQADNDDAKRYSSLVRLHAPGGGFDIIQSGNGYLLPNSSLNLNPENDEDLPILYFNECGDYEYADMCYCTCSPLSLDINGDGVKTSDEIIEYDIDGDGILDKINNSLDAVLVFDKDGNGFSGEDGSECFGDNTDLDGDGKADGFKDGFEALKAFAKQNGLIDGIDDNVLDSNDIKFLEENFGFKVKLGGYNDEATSLLDAGITEINLATTDETKLDKNFDGNQNDLMTQEGATFKINGEERDYADLWHSKK